MGAKKVSNRFTIAFNTKNPEHQRVIDILNSKNRSVAQYIVAAVLSYETIKNPMDQDNLELFVRKCMMQCLHEFFKDKNIERQTDQEEKGNDLDLDEELKSMIFDSMASFNMEL